MTAPPSDIRRVLADVVADLETIGPSTRSPGAGLLLWAYGSGYLKANATRRRSTRATAREDDDRVPGPRYDLGFGDHRARVAYQAAARLTGRIESVGLVAFVVAGGAPWRRLNPTSSTRPEAAIAAVAATTGAMLELGHRLETLDPHDVHLVARAVIGARTSTGPSPAALAALTWKARTILEAATAGGSSSPAADTVVCRMCGQAPALPKTGGRCGTCAYDHRAGQRSRATMLRDARAARARRLARGEGYGLA